METKFNFLEKVERYVNDNFSEVERVRILKAKFLKQNKEDIQQAIKDGYPLKAILEVGTMEFLKTGVPSKVSFRTKEGKKVIVDVKITYKDIEEI